MKKENSDRVRDGVLFGCHCDLNTNEVADQCVIALGTEEDCVHADTCTDKWKCQYWKPVTK